MQLQGDQKEVDVLNWMSRAALELIGQGGLGYSFDPLTEDVHNEFGDALARLLCVSSPLVNAATDEITFPYLQSMHV